MERSIPCKSINHPTTRRHNTGGCEKHTHKRETASLAPAASSRNRENQHQQTDCACIVTRCILEDCQEWSGGRIDNAVDVASDKEEHNEEYRACDSSDNHAADHDFGAFDRWIGDFCCD